MVNKLITFRNLVAAGILCLVAVSCTEDADTDNRLPAGKYPMTFTAAVERLTATRATTDGSWTGSEVVAIQIGEVKKYIAASDGSLTVESNKEPFYWTNQTMNVSAWYSSSSYLDTKQPTTFSVQENQSNGGYQASDFLYSAPQNITFQNDGSSPKLTFKHLPAKVVVNLKYGEGVTEQEVSGAIVSILNQATTSGTIADNGTVTQVTSGNTTIVSNVLISAASGYQKSVQALLVPQQMKDKQFIKVTIGSDAAAREYFYTPTGADAANLEAGKAYTYTVTVKRDKLEVTAGTSVSWEGGTDIPGTNITAESNGAYHLHRFWRQLRRSC